MSPKRPVKVVYWLGAGASAKALPVVGEMPTAFRMQAERITQAMADDLKSKLPEDALLSYVSYLHKMTRWAVQYGTIDTYARALFLLGRREDELAELKLHLSMYFMLEQLLRWSKLDVRPIKSKYKKKDHIDTRYMGWLALLMEPDSSINENVKVVSWNYDLQIDHAIAQFKGFDDFSRVYKEPALRLYPSLYTGDTTYYTTPSIIRLNGLAGFSNLGRGRTSLYSGSLDTTEGMDACVEQLFNLYDGYNTKEQRMLTSANETFTFAWEQTPLALEALKLSKMAMKEADILVVIGYSFPSFNRKVDKELFTAFIDGREREKKVVVQNPTMAVETFQQIMGIDGHHPNVLVERSTDQFHIPPEFF